MNVPFLNLKAQYTNLKSDIDTAIQNVISETAFIKGKYVDQFEKEFASSYGVKHCIGVANGTDAIYIILKMLSIGAGDEVITVANTWISSSETITQAGAKPVFVDIETDYYCIDTLQIEEKIWNSSLCRISFMEYYGGCFFSFSFTLLEKKYPLRSTVSEIEKAVLDIVSP